MYPSRAVTNDQIAAPTLQQIPEKIATHITRDLKGDEMNPLRL